jgi:hypothetical protein
VGIQLFLQNSRIWIFSPTIDGRFSSANN